MPEETIPMEWIGGDDGDEWRLEVEHDQMAEGAPMVVTVYVEEFDQGPGANALACLEPQAAREVASALMVAAFFADKAEHRRKSETTPDA